MKTFVTLPTELFEALLKEAAFDLRSYDLMRWVQQPAKLDETLYRTDGNPIAEYAQKLMAVVGLVFTSRNEFFTWLMSQRGTPQAMPDEHSRRLDEAIGVTYESSNFSDLQITVETSWISALGFEQDGRTPEMAFELTSGTAEYAARLMARLAHLRHEVVYYKVALTQELRTAQP